MLEFEKAAMLRDQIVELRRLVIDEDPVKKPPTLAR
jgi:protein-arginine kinase activator protein McsA